ncbi:MAG: hypothetical protein QXJ19_03865 [Candidatus Bathyarchaeia archaeon]|nr:hypothetical protein [Candidatus Bathyarchaeota archaeon]
MSLLENIPSTIEVFRRICTKVLYSVLGESAGAAVLFFLRSNLGCDPFDMFWENPKAVYDVMEKIFGSGAIILIEALVTNINSECDLSMDPRHFLTLMQRGDMFSLEEMRSFIVKVAESWIRRNSDEQLH